MIIKERIVRERERERERERVRERKKLESDIKLLSKYGMTMTV